MLSRSTYEDMTAQEVVSAFDEILANLPSDTAIENLSPIDVAHYYEALAQETRDGAREFAEGVTLHVEEEAHAYKSRVQQAEDYIEMAKRLSRVSSAGDDAEIYEGLRETRKHVLRERKRQEIQRLKDELTEMDRSLMHVRRPIGYPPDSDENHDYIYDLMYKQNRVEHILLLADIYAKQAEEEAEHTIGPGRRYEQNADTLREWVSDLDSDDPSKQDISRERIREFLRDRRDHLSAERGNHIREKPGYIPDSKLADRYN